MLVLRPTEFDDILDLSLDLRAIDRVEMEACRMQGQTVIHQITDCVDQSSIAYTVIDKKRKQVCCIFGVSPESDGSAGIWLLATETLYLYPVQLCKWSKAFVDMCMQMYRRLFNYVHANNQKAQLFLRYAGFDISESVVMINNEPFHYFDRTN